MTGEVFLLFLALLLALVCGNGQNLDTHYAATKQLDISDGIFSQMVSPKCVLTANCTFLLDSIFKRLSAMAIGRQR